MKRITKNMSKNKLYVVYLLLWLIPFSSYSQRYISGCITDAEDGSPIPSASVFFTNTTVGTTTDSEGNYRLSIPGEGSYRLTVSHVSYQSVVQDIEPGRRSFEFNAAMQIHELDELDVSAGIRFRQRDITLFWSKILGKNPSKRTIYATNPETVYYYYNPESRILKVTCREPLEIINYETGYHIQYMLDFFIHDYQTGVTDWSYQYLFTELEPNNIRQKNTWDKNRMIVYDISITKFIKSLYNNSLQKDGFVLANFFPNPDPKIPPIFSFFSQDNISSISSSDNSKTVNFANAQVILLCYGRSINDYDISILQRGKGNASVVNMLLCDSLRIFSDGTYSNQLHMSSVNSSISLLGLSMRLPLDYIPENSTIK